MILLKRIPGIQRRLTMRLRRTKQETLLARNVHLDSTSTYSGEKVYLRHSLSFNNEVIQRRLAMRLRWTEPKTTSRNVSTRFHEYSIRGERVFLKHSLHLIQRRTARSPASNRFHEYSCWEKAFLRHSRPGVSTYT
jgi:hypothetical protein